mmetsp:Transcript_58559/g.127346  ORF Transcript_58559/g.127346 Transcript_58559/m.127346 type:complete len:215 (-) Transcript_58559:184-828(-)
MQQPYWSGAEGVQPMQEVNAWGGTQPTPGLVSEGAPSAQPQQRDSAPPPGPAAQLFGGGGPPKQLTKLAAAADPGRFAKEHVKGLLAAEPEEVRGRLTNEWTTIGVVSALLGTMAFDGLLNPPDISENWDNDDGIQLYGIFMGMSALFGFAAVLDSTFMYVKLNVVAAEHVKDVVGTYNPIALQGPSLCMMLSVIFLLVAVILKIFYLYEVVVS